MGKYAPLSAFLRRWKIRNHDAPAVELTFDHIERILGTMLPASAAQSRWWRDDSVGGATFVHRKAWLDAGFEAHMISGEERVRFEKAQH
ncbi:hypothetical protein F1640_08830 [Novosphingobium sp. NBM11]|uniref:DUF7662 domain-containing protein n=1 Tax=Novosphingobium sp. NBM11 TaxID=2596914 RepID=UPI0018926645|nr:hypothetical protein [Novosphingobium sp. NBM11]MBF5090109.1 hypothetical protein [Novosphingobium sp. NBM11]